MDDLNNAMPQIQPADWYTREYVDTTKPDANTRALQIANDTSLTFPQKIDQMAKLRNWFSADTSLIDTYFASPNSSATHLAAELAAPIEESYSTGDYRQRLPGSEIPRSELRKRPSTEGQLWDLWYSILHAAKKIPWEDNQQQDKLLDLVKALKARPDPPLPSPMPAVLTKDWIWTPGALWSVLLMLGPSARESWNDSCGCGAGWTAVETAAWTNVNVFVARMVASGVASMFCLYGEWALENLEEKWSAQYSHQAGEEGVVRETNVGIAALWVVIAGREMYEKRERDSRGVDAYEIDIQKRGRNFPWIKFKHGVTGARWTWWKRRFEQESEDEGLDERVRELATKAAKLIQGFEKEGDNAK